jgi:DNA adenine methylase
MTKLRPPIKIHGGKYYLSKWIIENFPNGYEDMVYCEPFCGGASVFLNKNSSLEEIINDIDGGVISIFKSIRDELTEFSSRIKRIKYTERSFKMAQNRAKKSFDDYVDHAINEYILRRMSRGGLKKSFAWSDRERGGQPGDENAWKTMSALLPIISERLQKTTIVNKNFMELMKIWDEEETLFYLDPPYLHETRSVKCDKIYEYELTTEDHLNLLHLANNARGKVIISGYHSSLYSRNLKNWKCIKKSISNHSSQSKTKQKRIECLWKNY